MRRVWEALGWRSGHPSFRTPPCAARKGTLDIDTDFGTNATDEPKLTNATDGPNGNVLFVGKYKVLSKVLSKVPRKRLAGAAGCRDMVHVRVGWSLASGLGARAYPSAG